MRGSKLATLVAYPEARTLCPLRWKLSVKGVAELGWSGIDCTRAVSEANKAATSYRLHCRTSESMLVSGKVWFQVHGST